MLTEPEEHPLGDVFVDLTQSEQARQLFWDQVEALRGHLLRAVLGIAVGVGISAAFTDKIIKFLAVPIGGLQSLQIIEVTESIGVFMTVALLSGVAISLPYVVFEFWLFAAPGLRPRERLYGLVGIPMAAIFFIGGMAFTYYLLLPSALPFLLNFEGFKAQIRPESYFSFVTGLLFWIGIAFEFPLVIYVLDGHWISQAACPGEAVAHRSGHHFHCSSGHHSNCGPGQYGVGNAAHDRTVFH